MTFWSVGSRWSPDGNTNPIADIFFNHSCVFVWNERLREIQEGDIVAIFDGKRIVGVGYAKGKCRQVSELIALNEDEKGRVPDAMDSPQVLGIKVENLIKCNIPAFKAGFVKRIKDSKYKDQLSAVLKKNANQQIENQMNNEIKKYCNILKQKKQIILQGAPGTGKTYLSAEIAVSLIDEEGCLTNRKDLMTRYQELRKNGQIMFTTFHQSVDYEEFVEGYKPANKDGNLTYTVQNGIFKQICEKTKDDSNNTYILIIDEINRGNISKILGELITLLEADKRLDKENQITVTLPYSGVEFGVPSNLYIIATMNTADRSIGTIDYAVRRRFAFITLKSEKESIEKYYKDDGLKKKATGLFSEVEKIFSNKDNVSPDLNGEDLMVGHSYFMAENEDELKLKLDYEIKPLLLEYIKDGVLVGEDLETIINDLKLY